MDGKPSIAPGGAGRRPMLIKQEKMMGSPDSYPGNLGESLCTSPLFSHMLSDTTDTRVSLM